MAEAQEAQTIQAQPHEVDPQHPPQNEQQTEEDGGAEQEAPPCAKVIILGEKCYVSCIRAVLYSI